MKGKVFLDTNTLIYAHDMDVGSKHDTEDLNHGQIIEGVFIENPFL
jgi:predicted nucleic acid-binding protein